MKIVNPFAVFKLVLRRPKCQLYYIAKVLCVFFLLTCAINYCLKISTSLPRTFHLLSQESPLNMDFKVKEFQKRGNFTIMENILEGSDHIASYSEETGNKIDSVTFATYAEYFDLHQSLGMLVNQWSGFISIAIYAPAHDFGYAVQEIQYLRKCSHPEIKKRVSFHLFFETAYTPTTNIFDQYPEIMRNCDDSPPNNQVILEQTIFFRKYHHLSMPVALARNIARENAKTDYVLNGDINFVPVSETLAQDLNHQISTMTSFKNIILIPVLNGTETSEFKHKIGKMSMTGINSTKVGDLKRDFCFIGSKHIVPYDETNLYTEITKVQRNSILYSLCLLDFQFYILDGAYSYLLKDRLIEIPKPPSRIQISRPGPDSIYKELRRKHLGIFGNGNDTKCQNILKSAVYN